MPEKRGNERAGISGIISAQIATPSSCDFILRCMYWVHDGLKPGPQYFELVMTDSHPGNSTGSIAVTYVQDCN